jgi:hypothetical protein
VVLVVMVGEATLDAAALSADVAQVGVAEEGEEEDLLRSPGVVVAMARVVTLGGMAMMALIGQVVAPLRHSVHDGWVPLIVIWQRRGVRLARPPRGLG